MHDSCTLYTSYYKLHYYIYEILLYYTNYCITIIIITFTLLIFTTRFFAKCKFLHNSFTVLFFIILKTISLVIRSFDPPLHIYIQIVLGRSNILWKIRVRLTQYRVLNRVTTSTVISQSMISRIEENSYGSP